MEKIQKQLQARFETQALALIDLEWDQVEDRLKCHPGALEILTNMEATGGEPALVDLTSQGQLIFMDCSPESPKGRRSLCYDQEARLGRSKNPPESSAQEMAVKLGIDLLTWADYQYLQSLGDFDQKTSSWLQTPDAIRQQGGAIFGDKRYGHTFYYHNGADSYYASRGFRGKLII